MRLLPAFSKPRLDQVECCMLDSISFVTCRCRCDIDFCVFGVRLLRV
jgi:hypothetical protein